MALSDERSSTKAWERGAVGEERVAAILAKLDQARVTLLHDRRIPGSRANIDHIAVTAAGIWVIDAKALRRPPASQSVRGLFRPAGAEAVRRLEGPHQLGGWGAHQAAQVQPRWLTSPCIRCFVSSTRLGSVGRTDRDQRCYCDDPAPAEGRTVERDRGPFPVTAMAKDVAVPPA